MMICYPWHTKPWWYLNNGNLKFLKFVQILRCRRVEVCSNGAVILIFLQMQLFKPLSELWSCYFHSCCEGKGLFFLSSLVLDYLHTAPVWRTVLFGFPWRFFFKIFFVWCFYTPNICIFYCRFAGLHDKFTR